MDLDQPNDRQASPTSIPAAVRGSSRSFVNILSPTVYEIAGMSVGDLACLIQQQQTVAPADLTSQPLPNGLTLTSAHKVLGPNGESPPPVTTSTGRWTKPEHDTFLVGLKIFGKEWKRVASLVRTRTVVQTRTHAQKYFQKLQKAMAAGDDFVTAMLKGGEEGKSGDVGGGQKSEGEERPKRAKKNNGEVRRRKATAKAAAANINPTSFSIAGTNANNSYNMLLPTNDHFLMPTSSLSPSLADQETAADFLSSIKSQPPSTSHLHASTSSTKHSGTDRYGRTTQHAGEFGSMQIVAPTPAELRPGFPTPSPAGCGKRKHNELTAAQLLAGVSNGRGSIGTFSGGNSTSMSAPMLKSQSSSVSSGSVAKDLHGEMMGSRNSLPQPFDIDFMSATPPASPKLKPQSSSSSQMNLQIINPDILGVGNGRSKRTIDGEESPETPWDNELRALSRGSLEAAAVDTHMDDADEVGAMFDDGVKGFLSINTPNPPSLGFTNSFGSASIGSTSASSVNDNPPPKLLIIIWLQRR